MTSNRLCFFIGGIRRASDEPWGKVTFRMTKSFVGALALLLAGSIVQAAPIVGGLTTLDINSGTAAALAGLGLSIAPIAPGTFNPTTLVATFPITGGNTTTMIDHSGGLALTMGATTTDLENFIINLAGAEADIVTGTVAVGSLSFSGVQLFDIGAGSVLTVDSQLAADLVAIYSIPNLTGTDIGTASVNAITTPEPTALAFLGLGTLVAGLARRRK
jgi:hypothetical protein